LKLMTVLMKNPNFLILDEPTNDLDIFVMSVLEDYLRNFQGCLIVVSHDRYFMDKMVDHLFVFEGEGKVNDILGNYTVYRKNLKEQQQDIRDGKEVAQPIQDNIINEEKTVKLAPAEKKKLSYKEQSEFDSLEKEMENLETEKVLLTAILSNGEATNDELMEAGIKISEVVAELEEKTDRWLELSEFA
jgi:ABC transport system ATP-binding/permease protein